MKHITLMFLFLLGISSFSCNKDNNQGQTRQKTLDAEQKFERKTAIGGPPAGGGDGDDIGGCACSEAQWRQCLECGNTCGGCCVRVRSKYPPPYTYRYVCRYMGPGSEHDYPHIGIDLTPSEVGYNNYTVTRVVNGGSPITLETHTLNPAPTMTLLKYTVDNPPINWPTDTLIYTFSFYTISNTLISTEVWEYYP